MIKVEFYVCLSLVPAHVFFLYILRFFYLLANLGQKPSWDLKELKPTFIDSGLSDLCMGHERISGIESSLIIKSTSSFPITRAALSSSSDLELGEFLSNSDNYV